MHVWTVACGHTFATTAGRPFSPSQTRKNTSRTPRFFMSSSTDIQNLAPSPPVPAEDLDPRDQEILTEIRAHCAQLDWLAGHVTSFAKMMTRRAGERDLPGWLEQVEADDQPELHTFATGIRQGLAAVTAGLSLPYSSGSTEGNVNRLKALKRQMYGRASLDLLRKRVIHHPG